jgi:branched-chain amino acid transport system permease protein
MNLLLNGLLDGLNISLVAFAFGVVWAAIKTVNVVQAEVIPACGVALWVCRNDGMLTQYVVAILVAIALGVASFVIVRLVLRRAPDPRLMTLIVSIALTGMIGAVLQVITSSQTVSPPKVLPAGFINVAGVTLTWDYITAGLVSAGLMAVGYVVLRFSRAGLALRSTAHDSIIAAANGVDGRRVALFATVVGFALAGTAGIMQAGLTHGVDPFSGLDGALEGIVAMLIGGAGNPLGAVAGGLAVGFVDTAVTIYVGGTFASAIIFAALVVVILIRPAGIIGEW